MSPSFTAAYDGTPPWDIGRPQPAIVKAADAGIVEGRVIDLGCGTGEQAIFAASRGHEALGIDAVGRAIDLAKKKALARGVSARFLVHDALALDRLGETFDTAIDCGLFHTFTDDERPHYTRGLAKILGAGAKLLVLCFSDEELSEGGPRRVTRRELETAFEPAFELVRVEATRYESHLHEGGARAWFALLHRRP